LSLLGAGWRDGVCGVRLTRDEDEGDNYEELQGVYGFWGGLEGHCRVWNGLRGKYGWYEVVEYVDVVSELMCSVCVIGDCLRY
jgi:hypothetical protein